MNDTTERGLVCGFGDVTAGIGGLAWDLGEPGALLLSKGEVRPASFAIEEGGDATTIEITAGEDAVEATLSPRSMLIRDADAENPVGFRAISSLAEVREPGGTGTVECSGQITHWLGRFLADTGSFRHLAIQSGEAGILIATAEGPPGADHGAERISGSLIDNETGVSYEETLISTQYDGGGEPTRIGLELWPPDADQSTRAGATRVTGSLLGAARSGGTWAGLFRCHTDGTEGLGSYVLWRA